MKQLIWKNSWLSTSGAESLWWAGQRPRVPVPATFHRPWTAQIERECQVLDRQTPSLRTSQSSKGGSQASPPWVGLVLVISDPDPSPQPGPPLPPPAGG